MWRSVSLSLSIKIQRPPGTEEMLKNKIYSALFTVQTEQLLKTVLIVVQRNINKGGLISVHKSQIMKQWLHQTNLLLKYGTIIKTPWRCFSAGGGQVNVKHPSKIDKSFWLFLTNFSLAVSSKISFYNYGTETQMKIPSHGNWI